MSSAAATLEPLTLPSPRATARAGGFFWLMTIVTGAIAMAGAGVVVPGDAEATAAAILAREGLFRSAVAADLLATACYAAATLFVYVLLKPVSRNLSLLAAFFSLLGCAGGAVSFSLRLAPLVVLQGSPGSGAFSSEEMKALAYVLLRLPVGSFTFFFFGLHVFLVGVLVLRSTFLPRAVGALLLCGGLGWLTYSLANLLSPALGRALSPIIMVPGILAEATLTLWLLAGGVDVERWREQERAGNR